MTHKIARTLFLALLALAGFGLLGVPGTGKPSGSLWASPIAPQAPRLVFVAGGLAPENLVAFTANVAASGHPGIILVDSAEATASNRIFLSSFQPTRVVPVGTFADGIVDLECRLEVKTAPVLAWKDRPPELLWTTLFPRAERVVVCPAEPLSLLLQSACLAGVLRAPLFVIHDQPGEIEELRIRLEKWGTRNIYAAGATAGQCPSLPEVKIIHLANEKAVAACHLRHLAHQGPIRNIVVANPADVKRGLTAMSSLAPWVALQKQAALVLTNDEGDNVAKLMPPNLHHDLLGKAEALILVADLKAIPMEQRPNPIEGKDAVIEMEPLTPHGTEPFTFATGRLFNEDLSVAALVLARERLLADSAAQRKALVVSNPGGSLPLLETFSRNTIKELLNGGYQTTALVGKEVNQEDLRRLLPEQDIFLWEGHYNTMVKEYKIQEWDEPLRPSLVFLQSCLALSESKAQPFLQRGAVSVVGTSTRTYSASGGACALAFFDALLYEGQSVGGSLRQAKNFLLAYTMLKEKRLGKNVKLSGANIRSAWAFSLWGDPTLKLPRTETPDSALPHVHHQVNGNTIVVNLPDTKHDQAASDKYRAQILPNGRLAGLVSKKADEGKKPLIPFIFLEVHLPKVPPGKTPELHSRLPGKRWVFCWDKRRDSGYLLITPRSTDREELRFHIDWKGPPIDDQRSAARGHR